MLGDRLILPDAYIRNGTIECNKTMFGALWQHYCFDNGSCDSHFVDSEARYIPGVPGFSSRLIHGKLKTSKNYSSIINMLNLSIIGGVQKTAGQFI